MTKFNIPQKCHIRWQAALAVLEDLQEDTKAPFDMGDWNDGVTWDKWFCGTSACFAGWMAVAPYCLKLGLREYGDTPYIRAQRARYWLLDNDDYWLGSRVYNKLFSGVIDAGSRAKTLAYLERTLKSIFKESTGKTLVAPLTFYID